MADLTLQILAAVGRKSYQPLKPKALARKLGVPSEQYADFRRALRDLLKQGRVEPGKNHTIRPAAGHTTVAGIFRKTSTGTGYVRPHLVEGHAGPEIRVREEDAGDAATGDEVLVRIVRRSRLPDVGPTGKVIEVLERAT